MKSMYIQQCNDDDNANDISIKIGLAQLSLSAVIKIKWTKLRTGKRISGIK